MGSLERRIKKLTDELERPEFEHPSGRKAYYDQLFAEKEQKSEAAFRKLCDNLGLEPSAVHQEAQESDSSPVEVLCRHLGLDMQEFKRVLTERANLQ